MNSKTEERDAFGQLSTARTVMPAVVEATAAAQAAPDLSPVEKVLRAIVPAEHQDHFRYATRWNKDDIQIFRHSETGKYLYLAITGDQIRAYTYSAHAHQFVEAPISEAVQQALTKREELDRVGVANSHLHVRKAS